MRYVLNPSFAKLSAWYIIRGLRPTSPRTMIATERSFGGCLTYRYTETVKRMSRSDTKTATTLGSVSVVSPIIAFSGKGCDYVNTRNGFWLCHLPSALFTTTMASGLASSSLRAIARTSVQPRRHVDSALRSWVRFVSSTPARQALHRGPTLVTASDIYAPKPAPVPSVNPTQSKCRD